MDMRERAAIRRRIIKTNLALNHDEAEEWDLRFWQEQSPEERLSALIAIRKDVDKVNAARRERKD